MKALSVRQPFAFFISEGAKTIELRSRPTNHRGPLLICASKSGGDWWYRDSEITCELPKGAHACVVNLVDCRPATKEDAVAAQCEPEDITEGMWAWVLSDDSTPVLPTPVVGRLNMFDVADELIDVGDVDKDITDYYRHGEPPKNANILAFE